MLISRGDAASPAEFLQANRDKRRFWMDLFSVGIYLKNLLRVCKVQRSLGYIFRSESGLYPCRRQEEFVCLVDSLCVHARHSFTICRRPWRASMARDVALESLALSVHLLFKQCNAQLYYMQHFDRNICLIPRWSSGASLHIPLCRLHFIGFETWGTVRYCYMDRTLLMDIPLALNRSIFTEKIKLCMWQHVHPAEVFALFLHPRFFGPLLDGTSLLQLPWKMSWSYRILKTIVGSVTAVTAVTGSVSFDTSRPEPRTLKTLRLAREDDEDVTEAIAALRQRRKARR